MRSIVECILAVIGIVNITAAYVTFMHYHPSVDGFLFGTYMGMVGLLAGATAKAVRDIIFRDNSSRMSSISGSGQNIPTSTCPPGDPDIGRSAAATSSSGATAGPPKAHKILCDNISTR